MFSPRNFTVFGLTFRSLISFEFIFVYDVRVFSLFVDDMILYIENPKDATRNLLELINEYRTVLDI